MSTNLVQLINNDINSNDILMDENIRVLRVQFLKKSNILKVFIKSTNELDKECLNNLKVTVGKKFNFLAKVELVYYKDVSNITVEDICNKHWIDVVGSVSAAIPIAKGCLSKSNILCEGNNIRIINGNKFITCLLKNKGLEKILQHTIEDMFSVKSHIKMEYDEKIESEDYFKERESVENSIIKGIISDNLNHTSTEKQSVSQSGGERKKFDKNTYYEPKQKNSSVIYGKSINNETVPISTIDEASGVITILGDIFKVNIIETKSGRKIVTIFITDYTSSITVKCFPRPKDTEKLLEEVKEGLYCKVRGEATYDTFAKDVVIMGRDIVKCNKIERMDTSIDKRVELHLHTTMSAMDGMTSVSKLVKRAADWGHKAIAVTDHGVVQAYPEAMQAGKSNNIKILYGVETYLVNDGEPIIIDAKEKTISDTFVVFDLETTGLSSKNDKIIEIGAVKIKEGKVIDSFSTFVNPGIRIPDKIVELTSINNETVIEAPSIEKVLPEFMKFIGDDILVAHNANFDVSFIKKNCRDMNLQCENSVMDTVLLSKFLIPELKRYKLNTICKHLDISLENHHRAVDDAKAASEIMLWCFNKLEESNLFKLQDINSEFLKKQDIKKLPTYHLIILVKNMVGLKNLYKLISRANLDYFYRRPRMPRSLINSHKEGLIIGSACEAGELFRALLNGKTDEELKEMIKFYDYLEIQPLDNNNFMIRNGIVKDNTEIKDLNKRICELGERYDKPVVATGDVHFLDPSDETFRKILMSGRGFDDADNQPPLYLKTTEEMLHEFSYLGTTKAKEVVITNSQKIADMIENVKPIPDETFPPKIPGAEEDIRDMTLKKVHSIYGEVLPDVVQKRLDKELSSIINNGYAVLYLIAQKLVAKSAKDGYLVGSRGSVGSSFVATMSSITEVNGLPPHYVCPKCKHSEFFTDGSISSGADLPDKNCPVCDSKYIKDGHDIPFETFLGFNGDKEPDIDLNFSGEYQSVVHKYTEVLFGKGHVFKAGTIGTVAEKTAYGYVKKYLAERNITVPQAEIERLTLGCTGIKKTSGQHPGGVMVVPSDNEIYNFTPIQHPADDSTSDVITTHFDYHSISGRLLKLDILGHDDPTVLRMLQDLTGVDPKSIPLGDEKVMSLFNSPEALGVTKEELDCEVGTYGLPEFGTKFVRQMLLDTKPKSFADLVRISGLSHGTDVWINNAQYYIKEGYTTLKDCIATRDDIMIYLMHMDLEPKTAFSIMEKVRKGKGLSEEHEAAMREKNVPDWYVDSCKKIKYMFPKGHAVAYVMMAVRIAYFKVYYPRAYYTTYFTVRADDFDANLIIQGEDAIKRKMKELYELGNNLAQKDKGLLTILEISYEMNKRGIKFLKVDLYKSSATKFLIEGDSIRLPISSLTGVGENAAKGIVEARKLGEFISKEDLRLRAKVSKSAVITLAEHGCLHGLPDSNQLSLFTM
ncbi:PolC-type DNA polymerase III [Clostridium akagii]|uniref:PolC-type DNA polymerase III n=1 Tax=Clostridium akagii TaxID=91623 RepID=UPI00047E5BDF|nr:PolC-type DNA polymerase III [Clostridium akagii]